ncbi:pyruvate dehydrogenase complex dihydrolipoamide acetyltransferase [Elstera cyanobacteriorum]|uniref:pyruvate dehydrogenase complex dihydrolipoamide acetyltransferase n=1 Tax=Elstera cyanobacteriorum TaxID=2022747 RepID=UPI002355F2D3|nr:pyruvate dehydrogenase complex dihydrolipoamide acetyltransferase [Elstera cyanobacteriorum]MCK6442114.1 pyruvate dehydrogenase complex dihydrolipoamide acetyltransferase [Elstera cyanobacteriorum]
MPIQILMPALSPTMTEGNLARWLKKEGDAVKAGDVLAEIETDKATMEVEAVDEGTLGKILVAEGSQGVKVNEPIALLLEEGELASALSAPLAAAPAPAAAPVAAVSAPAAAPVAAAPVAHGARTIASPLAKRLAEQAGIDLATVKGSGPNGRIVKADVEAAKARGPVVAAAPVAAAAPAPAAVPAAAPKAAPAPVQTFGLPAFDLVPHSSMRKTIARRLTEAKQNVPHFYLTVDVGLDALLKLRTDLNARGEKSGVKLSVNDMIIRASALALKKVPGANAAWSDEGLMQFKGVDIAVAVSIPGGLITPIIRDADKKGLAEISAEIKDLAARAKAGKLKPEEFTGGTFSISNLGMFGIREFAAIINPPQSCILAVGAGEQRPVVRNGALAVETQMSCTLSVDHRVVDGALGAEWLQAFKGLVEDPLSMML